MIGLSSGGMDAMKKLFPLFPENFGIPVIVVQHLSPLSDGQWIPILNRNCNLLIKEADEKEKIKPGTVYIAPPNYHLLVEEDRSFTLTIEERVSYARPSIDVLFETAAYVYGEKLIGVVLTGSNHDGTAGLKHIKNRGGLCIVQDPGDAYSSYMPATAIREITPQHILNLDEISQLLITLDKQNKLS